MAKQAIALVSKTSTRGTTMKRKLPREALREVWQRSGLSAATVARQAGYTSTAGFYNLMQERQGDRPIPAPAIKRLIPILVGLGQPPITIEDLVSISDGTPGTEVGAMTGPSTVAAIAKTVGASADLIAAYRETPGALLKVTLRAERGTYIEAAGAARQYGVSRIGARPDYAMADQTAVLVADDHAETVFRRGTFLHVVKASAYKDGLTGRVAVALVEKHPGLVEVTVARVASAEGTVPVVHDLQGKPVQAAELYIVLAALVLM